MSFNGKDSPFFDLLFTLFVVALCVYFLASAIKNLFN